MEEDCRNCRRVGDVMAGAPRIARRGGPGLLDSTTREVRMSLRGDVLQVPVEESVSQAAG